MSRWDSLGTSKTQTPPKAEAPHGMKKRVDKICPPSLLPEIQLPVHNLGQKSKTTQVTQKGSPVKNFFISYH